MNSMQQENKSSGMSNLNDNPHQQHIGQLNRLQQQNNLHNQQQQQMRQQNQLHHQMGQLNQPQQQNQLQQQLLQKNQQQMQMGQNNLLHHQMSQQNQLQQQKWRQNHLQLQMGQQNQLQRQMGQLSQLQNSQQMAQQSRLKTQEQQNHLQQQQMRQENPLQLQQMSPQSQLQQQQVGQLGSGSLSQSGLMGQRRHLQMFSGEAAVDSAANFNLQNQFLATPRENAGFMQGSHFHPSNSPRQSLPGIQTMGVTGSPNFNSSFGCNQQRMALGQLRQQLSYQNALAAGQAQKISMNAQISGLSLDGQLGMIQNAIPQQQQPMRMPGMTSAYSSLHQQQMLLQHELTSTQWHRNSAGLSAGKLSQLLQQQTQMGCPQVQQQHMREQTLPQQLPHQHQIHRAAVPGDKRCLDLTGSPPHTTTSGIITLGGSLSQGREACNRFLGRRRIQDLVAQMGLNGSLEPELENLFLGIADNFIESVTAFSGDLAKHRNSSTLEAKDVLLHLEKNWNLTLPGYSSEEREHNPDHTLSDAHKRASG